MDRIRFRDIEVDTSFKIVGELAQRTYTKIPEYSAGCCGSVRNAVNNKGDAVYIIKTAIIEIIEE